ncbi:MAG TPA: prepilin-type N-terminal cleavage/methylation domain-containing protein [Thermoanaerobaculia bacterium]|nr:prepilin-type N-terminal cleavage/methylation domain-containing protein [Thermoanaerobaculia bacterium]
MRTEPFSRSRPRSRRETGFSLIEVLVSILIMMVVVIGMMTMFDRSAKITKTENSVTDAQQSVRYAAYQLVREARMAGAGGVPASLTVGTLHQLGVSLNLGSTKWGAAAKFLSNNVNAGGSGDVVCIGGACGTSGAHHVRVGTDILHVRGVIANAVFDLGSSNWSISGTTGTLVVNPCTKFSDPTATASSPCFPNGTNDMSAFDSSLANRLFVMSDALGNVGVGLVSGDPVVAKVDSSKSCAVAKNCTATVTIAIGNAATPDTTYPQTLCPNGAFPIGLTVPTRGGILDDRVYFIDDGPSTATNCNSAASRAVQDQSPGPCHPVLSYADWVTGDSSASPFSTATVTPVADDVEDLQVAYGIDFYDAVANTGTFTSPAPTKFDTTTGLPLDYPSDNSLSITTQATFTTIVNDARGTSSPNADPSEDVSSADADEWIWNRAGEPASGTFDYNSDLSRLRGLEVALLAKGSQPDPSGRAPGSVAMPAFLGAFAYPLMDSAAETVSQPTSGIAFPYRRRTQTLRIMLRNFNLQ